MVTRVISHWRVARRTAIAGFLIALCSNACSRTLASEQKTEVVVFAAVSLRDVFGTIGSEYTAVHPNTTLAFNFAGTQELRTQVEHGANADVFAGADAKHSDELVRHGLARTPRLFAQNEPILVVSQEMSMIIRSFGDLPNARRVVLGVPEVPIGRYAMQILDNAANKWGADFRSRVESKVVSRELNVRQVLSKVVLGEADAGIVYRGDVGEAVRGKVVMLSIPSQFNVLAHYPIAVLTVGSQPEAAEQWVDFVLSDTGRGILTRGGFQSTMLASAK